MQNDLESETPTAVKHKLFNPTGCWIEGNSRFCDFSNVFAFVLCTETSRYAIICCLGTRQGSSRTFPSLSCFFITGIKAIRRCHYLCFLDCDWCQTGRGKLGRSASGIDACSSYQSPIIMSFTSPSQSPISGNWHEADKESKHRSRPMKIRDSRKSRLQLTRLSPAVTTTTREQKLCVTSQLISMSCHTFRAGAALWWTNSFSLNWIQLNRVHNGEDFVGLASAWAWPLLLLLREAIGERRN